jgi:hypothetical protein
MMLMPFGKHKGAELDAIPAGYLTWLITTELRDPLRDAVVAELERRKGSTTTAATTNHATRRPVRRRPARRPGRELPVPRVCDICGLRGTAERPLVHESCFQDGVPF